MEQRFSEPCPRSRLGRALPYSAGMTSMNSSVLHPWLFEDVHRSGTGSRVLVHIWSLHVHQVSLLDVFLSLCDQVTSDGHAVGPAPVPWRPHRDTISMRPEHGRSSRLLSEPWSECYLHLETGAQPTIVSGVGSINLPSMS